MEFEEFCATAISMNQLEALARWDDIAVRAFEYFEQEGNKVTSVEELARVNTHFQNFYLFSLSTQLKCHRQFMQGNEFGPHKFFFTRELAREF